MRFVTRACASLLVFGCLGVSMSAQAKNDTILRKIFKAIPSDYFAISCCDGNADEFITKHATIVDEKNGFMSGADEEDPQSVSFEMALFPRSDGTYIVGLHSEAQRWSDYYFPDCHNGKLKNISKTIPQYSLQNIYEMPSCGKTIHVFRKKYDRPGRSLGVDNSVTKGKALYDLVWENGKFVVKQNK